MKNNNLKNQGKPTGNENKSKTKIREQRKNK